MMTILLHVIAWTALAQATDERTAHWHEDVQALYSAFSEGQKDFGQVYPQFQADLQALKGDVPKLSDSEIVLRLMKTVASANIGHNLVQTPMNMGFFDRLPLMFMWHSDGLAIIGASEEYRAASGSRVLKIGDKTPEQLVAELAPYVSHETDSWLRQQAMALLRCKAVLEHEGLLDADGRLTLTLQDPAGKIFTLPVKTADPRAERIPMETALHLPPTLAQSHPQERFYWHEYLAGSSTLYIR